MPEDTLGSLSSIKQDLEYALRASQKQLDKILHIGDPTPHYYLESSLEKIDELIERLSNVNEDGTL